jgi:hypothetical protein
MHFGPVLGRPQKNHLQPSRDQQFADDSKMRPLYDKVCFCDQAVFGDLVCNVLRLNVFSAKTASCKTLQIRVNYITRPPRKAKKTRFLLTRFSGPQTKGIGGGMFVRGMGESTW